MFRIAIASALLLAAGSIAGRPATSVVGRALAPAPQSRVQAEVEIDNATAAALIGAISSQFAQRSVRVRLEQVQLTPAGIVQRDVHGSGELQIGRDTVWIPFRFRALYDTEQASVGSPELTLGRDRPSHVVAGGSAVAKALAHEVGRRLRQEFTQQATGVRLHHVRSAPAGTGYLRLEADGVVMFDTDARTATRIHALYDPGSRELLQLEYQLGVDSTPSGELVAMR